MGLFSTSEFDDLTNLIDKATSEFIPAAQEDLVLNLEITDVIKSKRVPPKDALRLLLVRLTHDNPNVQLLTLQLLDKCVKNAGKHFLVELAGREFVDVAISLMDDEEYGSECNQIVQDRLIELFQEWALIFQSDPSLSYLFDVYTNLKTSKRVIFPKPSKALDLVDPLSIVSTLAPPEWSDSPNCQRCRDAFTMTNRKHHCRKCGGTFCQLCSSNEMVLLEMGINEPVRVCDSCYKSPPEKEKRKGKLIERKPFEETEDPELKKAIELSLKDQQGGHVHEYKPLPDYPEKEEEDALKKAIEASLKEVGPSHLKSIQKQPVSIQKHPKIKYFSDIEVENVKLFHQLIGRLVKSKPTMNSEDVEELKKLAAEMRCLLKRPIESDELKDQLVESLQEFDSMFSSTPQQPSDSVASSSDLSRMRTEILGKSPEPIAAVRSRLGSMSIESQPVNSIINEVIPNSTNNQQYLNMNPIQIPSISPIQNYRHTINGPIGFNNTPFTQPQSQFIYPNHHHMIRPPMQLCPDMTIHPHPIHPPMAHANPYAKKIKESEEKKSKKSKSKKKKEDNEKADKKGSKKRKIEKKKAEESEKKSSKKKEKIKSDSKEKKEMGEKDLLSDESVDDKKEQHNDKIDDSKRKKIGEDNKKRKKSKDKNSEETKSVPDEKSTSDKSGKKRMKKNDKVIEIDDKSGEKRIKKRPKNSKPKKEPPNLIDL